MATTLSSVSILDDIAANHKAGLVTFTVDQYHRMIEAGIFGEETQCELLEGFLVLKDRGDRDKPDMNVGTRHVIVVTKLYDFLSDAIRSEPAFARCQSPITLSPDSEPEPDVSIAIGRLEDYIQGHPGPSNLVAVMEVSDSSLSLDRGLKRQVYANAGIACYWIVNLVTDRVEVYEQPRIGRGDFAVTNIFSSGDTVSLKLPGGKTVNIPVDEILA